MREDLMYVVEHGSILGVTNYWEGLIGDSEFDGLQDAINKAFSDLIKEIKK